MRGGIEVKREVRKMHQDQELQEEVVKAEEIDV